MRHVNGQRAILDSDNSFHFRAAAGAVARPGAVGFVRHDLIASGLM